MLGIRKATAQLTVPYPFPTCGTTVLVAGAFPQSGTTYRNFLRRLHITYIYIVFYTPYISLQPRMYLVLYLIHKVTCI